MLAITLVVIQQIQRRYLEQGQQDPQPWENSNIMENQDTRFLFNIQPSSEDMGNECGKDSQTHDGEEVFVK